MKPINPKNDLAEDGVKAFVVTLRLEVLFRFWLVYAFQSCECYGCRYHFAGLGMLKLKQELNDVVY